MGRFLSIVAGIAGLFIVLAACERVDVHHYYHDVVYVAPAATPPPASRHHEQGFRRVGYCGEDSYDDCEDDVPSPYEVYRRVPHVRTYACAPCAPGYVPSGTPPYCRCSRTTWHPGPPPPF